MDEATAKPLRCPACGSGRVAPPFEGLIGDLTLALQTIQRPCLDCGFVLLFVKTRQLHALRIKYGVGDDPAEAMDSL